MPPEYSLEPMPEFSVYFIILDYPLVVNLAGHYFWAIFAGLADMRAVNFFKTYYYLQAGIHLYYYFAVYMKFHVIKRIRYEQAWRKEYRYLFFPFYGLLLGMTQISTLPLVWIIPSFFMTMFWHIHLHILKEMNRDDIRFSREDTIGE
jgi:hypothetical protein